MYALGGATLCDLEGRVSDLDLKTSVFASFVGTSQTVLVRE